MVEPGGMMQLHEGITGIWVTICWESLFLRPVWAKATAESPRKMRVDFMVVCEGVVERSLQII